MAKVHSLFYKFEECFWITIANVEELKELHYLEFQMDMN